MTGMAAVAVLARKAAANSNPSMPGISISVTTISARVPDLIAASA